MPASRALTGIQPSGTVHLGNYLGMIRPALELQERGETFYFVADLHALTSFRDAAAIQQSSREIAAIFLALGLDPQRSVLWRQSAVAEVCELSWILSCFTPIGQLERGHAVKAARDGGREASAGLLYYPVLQTADILLYDATVVPVGQDQRQHIEVARDTALRMNHHLGEGTLVVPEVLVREAVGVVPGLDGRKMSKSYGNVIPLMESSKKLRKAVMSIVTDSRGVEEAKDPETCTIFRLYAQVATPDAVAVLREKYLAGGYGYGHAKQDLFVALDALLSGPREAYAGWINRPADLDDLLAEGAGRARRVAQATLARLHDRLGLV